MPVPTPKSNESKDDFTSRCISTLADETDEDGNKKYPDNDQRVAICLQKWQDKSESTTTSLKDFLESDKSAREFMENVEEK